MSYRLEITLALLLAIAMGIAVWAANRRPKPIPIDPRSSTFLSGPQGSKGLHEVLVRLKRASERRRTPLRNLLNDSHRPAILAVVNPPMALEDDEITQVVGFVRGGGAVVAAGNAGGITRCAGWKLYPDFIRDDSVAVRAPAGLRLPSVARMLMRDVEHQSQQRLESLVKGESEEDAREDICRTLAPMRIDTIIVAQNGRPVIVRLQYHGEGSIVLAADHRWFTNRIWRNTDVPLVLVPLLTPRAERPGRVAWDEYNQAFGQRGEATLAGRTWSWLRESPAGWAILQLIAVALVWLAVTAVRFGPARSVIERRRRSPLEHLEALAAGLESANAADTAVQRLALGLRRRLNRAGQLAEGDVQPWLESLDLAMRGPRGRSALSRLRYLISEREASGERVLAAAQAVEEVWEELRPRQTREAF